MQQGDREKGFRNRAADSGAGLDLGLRRYGRGNGKGLSGIIY